MSIHSSLNERSEWSLLTPHLSSRVWSVAKYAGARGEIPGLFLL